MASTKVRLYRQQAEECRALIRLTDELRRRLSDLAAECDDRAREATNVDEELQRTTKFSQPSVSNESIEPLTLSIKEAGRLLGLGRSTIYRLIGDQELDTIKIGNRTLIKAASIRRLVEQD